MARGAGGAVAKDGEAPCVLVVAYKFPDVLVPGGSVRVEKFVKYLPSFGWRPVVLTVELPEECLVAPEHRGEDVHRIPSHYGAFVRAYRARYMEEGAAARRGAVEIARRAKNLLLVPDDAVLWWPRAIPAARELIRTHPVKAVFASGPPFSGLLLGRRIARRAAVPFVADFRDDWAGNPLAGERNVVQGMTEYPQESRVVRAAARVVHVTEASVRLYRERYPECAERMVLIANGFDEEDLQDVPSPAPRAGILRLLHAGTLKQSHPLPALFDAMARLGERVRGVTFHQVGPCHAVHRERARERGLDVATRWTDLVPRREMVSLLGEADVLVLLPQQDAETAVPGKVYEYLRAGRPVLCISRGNEATRFVSGFEGVHVHDVADVAGIAATLARWLAEGPPTPPPPAQVAPYQRKVLTGHLAALLDEVTRLP